MCTRFPFTTVGTPADAGRAGCAYGDKKQYVDAYLRAPGSEFSNSDDVVWAFVNDVAQWSRSGKMGWDRHMATKGSPLVLVDVGANVGGYTRTLLDAFGVPDGHRFAQIHAFEPYPVTFKALEKALGLPRARAPIFLHNVALTDAPTVERTGGSAEFFGAYLDVNPNPTGASIGRTEDVQVSVGIVNLTTPDAFFEGLEGTVALIVKVVGAWKVVPTKVLLLHMLATTMCIPQTIPWAPQKASPETSNQKHPGAPKQN
jgi:FkbM family methyltransferase